MRATHRQFAGDVGSERGLADATFLIAARRSWRAPPPETPASPCRFGVVHRNGAHLLPVRAFMLDKLEGAETRVVISFAEISHA
ncbi:hypothetical protein bpln_1g23460 [Burkholderia plantarii]|nr:hypothetical protein bpln_1g23460 [Burkholderia plantarii]